MKPTLRKVTLNPQFSFNVRIDKGEKLLNKWHYHPELELILLKGSAGTRIIGSSVENFQHNDLVMIGKDIPHTFIHDKRYLAKRTSRRAQALVIHFFDNFLGEDFLSLPELKEVQNLFSVARQGVCFNEESKKHIIPQMEKMLDAPPLKRLLILLDILGIMTHENSYRLLFPKGVDYDYQTNKEDENRINKIFEFTAKHYNKNIRLEEVASLVSLTKESFCRYFKSQTRKTYVEFLIEFRIGHACRMLIENQKSIKEIGYCCGYDNLSNFYHQFKKTLNKSPIEYQNEFFNLTSYYV
jgi:AraC-like DNA-binding protein